MLIPDLQKRPLLRHILYYAIYTLLMVASYLIIVSMISFFHFLLDHKLGIIEEWIFDRGWQIVILSKLIALCTMVGFFYLQMPLRYSVKYLIHEGMDMGEKREVFTIITFSLITVTLLSYPKLEIYPDVLTMRFIMSFMGNILFYLLDVFFIMSLHFMYPLEKKAQWIQMFLFPILFIAVSKSIFLFGLKLDSAIFCHMFLCLYLLQRGKANWSQAACYLAFFVAPVSCFLGMDAVWGDTYAIFEMTEKIGQMETFIITLVSFGYLYLYDRFRRRPA